MVWISICLKLSSIMFPFVKVSFASPFLQWVSSYSTPWTIYNEQTAKGQGLNLLFQESGPTVWPGQLPIRTPLLFWEPPTGVVLKQYILLCTVKYLEKACFQLMAIFQFSRLAPFAVYSVRYILFFWAILMT